MKKVSISFCNNMFYSVNSICKNCMAFSRNDCSYATLEEGLINNFDPFMVISDRRSWGCEYSFSVESGGRESRLICLFCFTCIGDFLFLCSLTRWERC